MSEPTSTDPVASSPKTGLSPMAWIAIGCGAVILLSFIAFVALGAFVFKKGKEVAQEVSGADSIEEFVERLEDDPARIAAEMAIRLNPELEIIETDEKKGIITFWNPETREKWTLDFEDVAAGRFGVSTEEGDFTFETSGDEDGAVTMTGPDGETRIVVGANAEDLPSWVPVYPHGEAVQGGFRSVRGDTVSGTLSVTTEDEPQEVLEHYRELFEDQDWQIRSESTTTSGDVTYASIVAELPDEGRMVNVGIVQQDGEVHVTISYNGKSEE